MELAFNLFVTLLVELPIVAFFFSKRKRKGAIMAALLVNLVTWIITKVLWFKFPDWDPLWIRAAITVLETIAYWFLFGRNWKKAILMSVIANTASYIVTKYVYLPPDFFQKKPDMIR